MEWVAGKRGSVEFKPELCKGRWFFLPGTKGPDGRFPEEQEDCVESRYSNVAPGPEACLPSRSFEKPL